MSARAGADSATGRPSGTVTFLFTDIEWGSATVLGDTVERLSAYGRPFRLLESLSDLDRPEDLARWPWLHAC